MRNCRIERNLTEEQNCRGVICQSTQAFALDNFRANVWHRGIEKVIFLPKTLALAKGGNSSDWPHAFLCSCQRFWWSFRKSLYLFHTVIYRKTDTEDTDKSIIWGLKIYLPLIEWIIIIIVDWTKAADFLRVCKCNLIVTDNAIKSLLSC